MTNEQKAQDLFKEWHKTNYIDSDPEDMIAFAAFCLDKMDAYWKTRCELAEKYAAATPVDLERFDASSAPHHRDVYNEFLKNNMEP